MASEVSGNVGCTADSETFAALSADGALDPATPLTPTGLFFSRTRESRCAAFPVEVKSALPTVAVELSGSK